MDFGQGVSRSETRLQSHTAPSSLKFILRSNNIRKPCAIFVHFRTLTNYLGAQAAFAHH